MPPSWLDDEAVVASFRAAIRAFWSAVFEVQRERSGHLRRLVRSRWGEHMPAEPGDSVGLSGRLLLAFFGLGLFVAAMTLIVGVVWILSLTGEPAPVPVPTGLTLPSDLKVVPPEPGLPPRIAGLSGTWQGRWDGELLSRLVVERVDRQSAQVVYAYAAAPDGSFPAGWARLTTTVPSDGLIAWGDGAIRFTFSLSRNGKSLGGRREFPGGVNFVAMRKVSPGSEGPSRDEQPTSVHVGHIDVSISSAAMQLARQNGVDLRAVAQTATRRIESSLQARHAAKLFVVVGQGIPEVGVSGFTDPLTGAVTIRIQERSPIGVKSSITRWVPPMLAHELFESKRVLDGPGFGRTLRAWLVTDGGADNFAHSLYASVGVFPWDRAITSAQERAMWSKAGSVLDAVGGPGDFYRWFLGTSGIPQWSAYTIGYHVVAAYLADHPDVQPADVATLPATTVVEPGGYRPPSR